MHACQSRCGTVQQHHDELPALQGLVFNEMRSKTKVIQVRPPTAAAWPRACELTAALPARRAAGARSGPEHAPAAQKPITSLTPGDFSDWSFDGSSTGQAEGNNSDCILRRAHAPPPCCLLLLGVVAAPAGERGAARRRGGLRVPAQPHSSNRDTCCPSARLSGLIHSAMSGSIVPSAEKRFVARLTDRPQQRGAPSLVS